MEEELALVSECSETIEKSLEELPYTLAAFQSFSKEEKRAFLKANSDKLSTLFLENSAVTRSFLETTEKKAFLSLQSNLILLSSSKILQRFLSLSENEQSSLVRTSLSTLSTFS